MKTKYPRSLRLTSLFSSLALNTRRGSDNDIMINCFETGAKFVENYFDEILNEIFFDTCADYGRRMFCDLMKIKQYDCEEAKRYFSAKYSNYKFNELKSEFDKLGVSQDIKFKNPFDLQVGSFDVDNFSSAFDMSSFFGKYLCPGVVLSAFSSNLDFDAFDSMDYEAYKWDKIAQNTFNFIDSLGGNI